MQERKRHRWVICSIETGWIALLLLTLALINSISRVTLSVAADPITEEFGLFSIKLEYSQAGILLLPLGVLSLPHPYGILVGKFIVSGWFLTGTSIGAMITPPLVVWLSVTWSWQAAFIVTGLMAVVVAVLGRC